MIQAKFGLPGIALRTLEVYTTATLEAALGRAGSPRSAVASTMDRLATAARTAFRQTVYDDPRVSHVLPRRDTRRGARSAAHRQSAGTAAVRTALARCERSPGSSRGRRRGSCWPRGSGRKRCCASTCTTGKCAATCIGAGRSFRSTVDLLQMVLAKADAAIAAHYDRQLVPPDLQALRVGAARPAAAVDRWRADDHRSRIDCSRTIRCSGARSTSAIRTSIRSISCRSNCSGAWRSCTRIAAACDPSDEEPAADLVQLRRSLSVTINGIAAGMRNTG